MQNTTNLINNFEEHQANEYDKMSAETQHCWKQQGYKESLQTVTNKTGKRKNWLHYEMFQCFTEPR